MDDYGVRKRIIGTKTKSSQKGFPSTYFVIQFSSKIKVETVEWLTNRIKCDRKQGGAELLVRKQPFLQGQVSHFLV